ncbi:MAG TPA: triose-phosphate isomerase [bacterium]|nr:triose-phosphate isomerase [bacterium]
MWIVGNWKMNGSLSQLREFAQALRAGSGLPARVRLAVCPPFPYLQAMREALVGGNVLLGAQNAHPQPAGAFTGEVSAAMLKDLGCQLCIAGHSERRALFQESDEFIGAKVQAVLAADLRPILCVGETLAQREAGSQAAVVRQQLQGALASVPATVASRMLIAYEPVWAIGTGRTASAAQAQEMHVEIRKWLAGHWGAAAADAVPILYGGSVNADNAAGLLSQSQVNGALVGGASLKAATFLAIAKHVPA